MLCVEQKKVKYAQSISDSKPLIFCDIYFYSSYFNLNKQLIFLIKKYEVNVYNDKNYSIYFILYIQ